MNNSVNATDVLEFYSHVSDKIASYPRSEKREVIKNSVSAKSSIILCIYTS